MSAARNIPLDLSFEISQANDPTWKPPAEKQLVLVDMDGTLADVSHRLHHVAARGCGNTSANYINEPSPDTCKKHTHAAR